MQPLCLEGDTATETSIDSETYYCNGRRGGDSSGGLNLTLNCDVGCGAKDSASVRNLAITLDCDIFEETLYDAEDAAEDYTPIWLTSLRGFQDFRSIEAERFNELLAKHLPLAVEDWTCDQDGWTFILSDVEVSVQNDETGPLQVVALSDTMPRKVLDPLRQGIRNVPLFCHSMFWDTTSFAIDLLQIVEEATSHQQDWHAGIKPSVDASPAQQGWDSKQSATWSSILNNPSGVDLTTIEDKAAHLLGEPIADICSRVAEDIRILHIEPVFRTDLVSKHLEAQTRIHSELLTLSKGQLRRSVSAREIRHGSADDTREGLAAHLAKPSVTFHGAPRHVMNSIVRYGFVVPGSEIGHSGARLEVRCGSTYGRGVYSSPDLLYASVYTDYQSGTTTVLNKPSDVPGFRMLVCATLMGRPLRVERSDARGVEGVVQADVHSHVSPNKMEYIVFESAQIIPCYVLHLDYGAEHAKQEFERLVANPTGFFEKRQGRKMRNKWEEEEDCPGDVQRKKQALKAAAAKWFPYGYGPSSGTSFVIEDIAEVSDDEEVYGDFQYQRIEEENEITAGKLAAGGSWFDEYQTVRKTKHEL